MAESPTLLTARPTGPARWLLARYFARRARRRFAAVLARGHNGLQPWSRNGNAGLPLLLVANHSSWWDAALPIVLSIGILHQDAYGMMQAEELQRYQFFRRAGIFSVDRSNARSAMRSIEYASSLLQGTSRVLWIFPQGIIAPNDRRPIRTEPGAAHIARHLGRVAIAPVAFRYEVGRDEHPLACMSIGAPRTFAGADTADPGKLNEEIARMMEGELDALRDAMLAEHYAGFETLIRGRRSVNAAWDGVRGRR
ncbi:MAG TPA: lysophospholipid acyltransferase family protein [Candidatus Kapabacteria bacterium]|nr:lysophospholipid acyltransferase family protein [Candidatus Kapabacteria bacterium]